MKVYMNGKLVPERDAKISVFDHGLLYGDGVFEGIRTYNGRVFMLDEHIERLLRSAKSICLIIGMTEAAIAAAVVQTCKANRCYNGYIRLLVTRGVGELGLNPYLCKKSQLIVIAANVQLYPKEIYEKGLTIVTVPTIRNHTESINPNIKSLNYLNNILAKIEAINAGCMEAIMLNAQGFVAEATGDNIFIVRGNTLITPPHWAGALEGITRSAVMRIAAEDGYVVREDTLSRCDLYTADEVFLTGTAAEVVPVVTIDRRDIGSGTPGPITRHLVQAFRQFVSSTGTPIR